MKTKYLIIPTDVGFTYIPLGMSMEDLQLVLETLDLWLRRISPTPETIDFQI